jgi:hypothetical protein
MTGRAKKHEREQEAGDMIEEEDRSKEQERKGGNQKEDKEAREMMNKHLKAVQKTSTDNIRNLNTYVRFLKETGRNHSKEGLRFQGNSTETFKEFSIWAMTNLNKQDLDKYTVALNMAHHRLFGKDRKEKPWSREEIKEIKQAYVQAKSEHKVNEAREKKRKGTGADKQSPKRRAKQMREKGEDEEAHEALRPTDLLQLLAEAERNNKTICIPEEVSVRSAAALIFAMFLTCTRPNSIGRHKNENPDGLRQDIEVREGETEITIRGFKHHRVKPGGFIRVAKGDPHQTKLKVPSKFTIPCGEARKVRARMLKVIEQELTMNEFAIADGLTPENAHRKISKMVRALDLKDTKGKVASSYAIRVLAITTLTKELMGHQNKSFFTSVRGVVAVYARWTTPKMIEVYYKEGVDTEVLQGVFDFVAGPILDRLKEKTGV